MILKSNIGSFFIATILSFALLLPVTTQIIHALDGHQHEVCTDHSTHLHEQQLDCSICEFHLSAFDFKIAPLPEFSCPAGFCNLDSFIAFTETSSFTTHFYLRGPPVLS